MHDYCLCECRRMYVHWCTYLCLLTQGRGEYWLSLSVSLCFLSSNPPVSVHFGFGIAGYNTQPVTRCWDLNSSPYDYRVL